MDRKAVKIGMTVYHNILVHWGAGKVVGTKEADGGVGLAPGSTKLLYEVHWEHHAPTLNKPTDLRKRPNSRLAGLAVNKYKCETSE